MRPQRLLLSGVVVVLVLLADSGNRVVIGSDFRAIVIAIACGNIAWNAMHLAGLWSKPGSRAIDISQFVVDGFLALAAAAVADGQSSPLVWILLLVPVIDVAIRFGAPGAALGWLGISAAYVFLLSELGSPAEGESSIVGNGLQQVAALAAIAVPLLGIVFRLGSDLDRSARSRTLAYAKESQLRGITEAARDFSEARSPKSSLHHVVDTALRLGFDRVDVCLRSDEGNWQLHHAKGNSASVKPDLDRLLVRSLASATTASVGVSETRPEELQELHNLGYSAAVVAVVQTSEDEWLGVRAYCVDVVSPESPLLESLETLTSLCASSWVSTRTKERLERQKSDADYKSKHDSLTRLPNRSAIHEALEEALTDPRSRPAVMFMDLNGFKAVNDEFGHAAGDETLLAVAGRLKALSTNNVSVGRLGGDEFVIITTDLGSEQLRELADTVIGKLGEPIEIDGQVLQIGTSLGVAEHSGEDAATLMSRADQLMYVAKEESRVTGLSVYRFASHSDTALHQPS